MFEFARTVLSDILYEVVSVWKWEGKMRKHWTGDDRWEYDIVGEQGSLTERLFGLSELVFTDEVIQSV